MEYRRVLVNAALNLRVSQAMELINNVNYDNTVG
jgi:hypothetical protein